MFRIAVCDNDPEDLNALKAILEKYVSAHQEPGGKVRFFEDPRELESCLEKEAFEVFLLDILMPGMNGIQLGKEIRKRNRDAAVVYVTSSSEYALEAFDVYAFQYLLKPVDAEKLGAVLDRILENQVEQKRHVVSMKGNDAVINVVAEDVAYIENDVRRAIFVMRDGRKVESSRRKGTFEEAVWEVTEKDAFIQTHKSFFVNMKYIRELRQEFAVMDNGKEIPINRKRLPAVKSRYMEYISGGGFTR